MAGIGVTLPFDKGNRGYYNMSEDILTQIKSNFINLILTVKGERLNNPEFGCDIHHVMFDANTEDLETKAQLAVENAVEEWMPFLELEEFNILTDSDDINAHTARIYVKYRLINTPTISDEVLINF